MGTVNSFFEVSNMTRPNLFVDFTKLLVQNNPTLVQNNPTLVPKMTPPYLGFGKVVILNTAFCESISKQLGVLIPAIINYTTDVFYAEAHCVCSTERNT